MTDKTKTVPVWKPQWIEIERLENFDPYSRYILVRNSAGVFAAVNDVFKSEGRAPASYGEYLGYRFTPEAEELLISDITHYAEFDNGEP